MQEKIDNAKVGIVGLGGIGSWVTYSLALAGVTSFTLVDSDVISLSNLSRQSLYNITQIGKKKVIAAQDFLSTLNPKIKCSIKKVNISNVTSCRKLVRNLDLVINCADYPDVDTTNRIVSYACYPLNLGGRLLCYPEK